MRQTEIQKNSGAESIEGIHVNITHIAMKYRCGFIEKEEALRELEELWKPLNSEDESVTKSEVIGGFWKLFYDIEDDKIIFYYKTTG